MEITLKIDGMTCNGCKAAVERVLLALPGVDAAAVDLQSGIARISSSAGIAPAIVADAVEVAGYEAQIEY